MSDAEKPELRRANDNPWYCLATLYGDQPASARVGEAGGWDEDLAAKNRVAWNRWMAGGLTGRERQSLRPGFSEPELEPFTHEELGPIYIAFGSRIGRERASPPEPTELIDFRHTHFDRAFVFRGFLCPRSVDFRWARFSGFADFHLATFLGWIAVFSSATFSGRATFTSATFSGFASFGSVTFSGGAYFDLATFSRPADFSSTTFSENVEFQSATFSGGVDFRSTTFSKSANFLNATFNAKTIFAHVVFGAGVPVFHGAKLHEATEWHRVTWPEPPQGERHAQDQVYAYERLKQEMEQLKKHEDEQLFFRKELRARRGLVAPGSGAWLLNYLYEVSSDYGQSIGRPAFWLFVSFAIGFFVFANAPVFKGAPMTIQSAAGLSLANIFSFLPAKREIMTQSMIENLSDAAQFLGGIQSVLGLIFFFLLGLALRSRFRMR